jgi:hypothetical protein
MGSNKKTKLENFIIMANAIHGNKYDYSNNTYFPGMNEKVSIICPIHGEYYGSARNHIYNKSGCRKCANNDMRTPTKDFISECKKKHGNRYDYSLVEFTNMESPVKIICSKHGIFEQVAKHHKLGSNCPQCVREGQMLSYEEFLARCKEIHGNTYSYEKMKYLGMDSNITVICPIHGEFSLLASNHIGENGNGCAKCAIKERTKDIETFIAESQEKYGMDHFDYSQVDYINNTTDITIICKYHNETLHLPPKEHLAGNGGCHACDLKRKRNDPNDWLNKAKIIWGDVWDYSDTHYISNLEKVNIRCKKHNIIFEQSPVIHLSKKIGCPKCKVKSKGEYAVEELLKTNNILYDSQKSFPDCKYINLLYFDFCIYNNDHTIKLLIEYDGAQHYRPIKWGSNMSDEDAEELFKTIQERDNAKTRYCIENNLTLIRLTNEDDIEKVLAPHLV